MTRREFVAADDEHSAAAWDRCDEAVTVLAERVLTEDGPDLSFVYLGAVDVTGHTIDTGPHTGRRPARPTGGSAGWSPRCSPAPTPVPGRSSRSPTTATSTAAAAAAANPRSPPPGRPTAGPGLSPLAPSPVTRHTDISPLSS